MLILMTLNPICIYEHVCMNRYIYIGMYTWYMVYVFVYLYVYDSWSRNLSFSCLSVKFVVMQRFWKLRRKAFVCLLSSFLEAMPFHNLVSPINSFPQAQLRDQVVNNACANSDRSFAMYTRRRVLYEWFVLYILCIPFQMESIINFRLRLAEIRRQAKDPGSTKHVQGYFLFILC